MPASSYSLRPATPADVDEMAAMLRAVGEATYGFMARPRLQAWLADYADRERWCAAVASDAARVLVAQSRTGDLAGMAQLALPEAESWWGDDLYLSAVYVRERGRGVGGALVERLLAFAPHWPRDHVSAHAAEPNERALRFLAAHGFRRTGERRLWLGTYWIGLRRAVPR